MWTRVFSPLEIEVPLRDVEAQLRACGLTAPLQVTGDDLGWKTVRAGDLHIERYLLEADNLRSELDTWAAVVEQWDAGIAGQRLMQRLISSRQVVTFTGLPQDSLIRCARVFADRLAGFYHTDGIGFSEADGRLIVAEPS